jgi:transcriptional regulator with XRE-family HTH domain
MLKNFGEDLKKIRERKKITLQEVALKTRISMHIFEKMESGDFSFEIPTYIRAYLKQYAIALDENPDVVLKDYDLAKVGKYQTKVFEEVKISEAPKVEEKKEEPKEEPKQEHREEPKEEPKIELPKKEEIREPVKQEKEEIKPVDKKIEQVELKKSETIKHRATNDDKIKQSAQKDYKINITPKADVREPSSFRVDSSIMKSLMIIVFILLGGAGLYFLITAVFTGKGDVEIVRQNFDEIVQENEKNILGKKTPAEIADSIRKAEEDARLLAASQGDSLSLMIIGTNYGEIIIIPDSIGINDKEIISFGRSDTGIFKASKFFLITTSNSDAFKAVLNGKTLEFDRRRFNNLVINKDGIVPQTSGSTTRTRSTQRSNDENNNNNTRNNNSNPDRNDTRTNTPNNTLNETTQP